MEELRFQITEETEAESLNGCGGSGRARREGAAERAAAE